jgi:hypothetical protein
VKVSESIAGDHRAAVGGRGEAGEGSVTGEGVNLGVSVQVPQPKHPVLRGRQAPPTICEHRHRIDLSAGAVSEQAHLGYAQVWCTGSGGDLVLGSLNGLAVAEAEALDHLGKAVRAIEPAPMTLCGLGELEDHGEGSLA